MQKLCLMLSSSGYMNSIGELEIYVGKFEWPEDEENNQNQEVD